MANVFYDVDAVGLADGTTWANAYTDAVTAWAALLANDILAIAVTSMETLASNSTSLIAPTGVLVITSTVSGVDTITYQKSTIVNIESPQNSFGDINLDMNIGVVNGLKLMAGRRVTLTDAIYNECGWIVNSIASNGGLSLNGSTVQNYCDTESISTSFSGTVMNGSLRTIHKVLGGSLTSGSTNTSQNAFGAPREGYLFVDDVDCSNFAGGALMAIGGVSGTGKATRCALNAATTDLYKGTPTQVAFSGVAHACDSSNTTNRKYQKTFLGELISDTGIKLSDSNFSYSNKLISASGVYAFFSPFRVLIAVDFADFTTSKTITVEVAQDGTTTGYNDDELWAEVTSPDGLTAKYLITSTRAADNQSGATVPVSTEAYDGLSGTNVKQKIEVVIPSGGKEGSFEVYVCLAKPSSTAYVTVKSIA